ncbi:MAG: acyltransferase [Verrucomicrobia bacterium]|nr:acyltransferase [Verrucomicrobiota bacterium]
MTHTAELRLNEYVDSKIRNICLILSVMVAFNHSRTIDLSYGWEGLSLSPITFDYLGRAPLEIFLEHSLSGALGRITNPFFFLISGFLFFYNWRPTLGSWLGKMHKRLFTLLGPFVIWSLLGKLVNFVTFVLENPEVVAGSGVSGLKYAQSMCRLFLSMPSPGQLWFVRALMLIMLGAPVLAWLITKLRAKTLLLIYALYLSPYQTPWDWVDKSAICFFAFGATLGYLRANIWLGSRSLAKMLVGFWFLSAGLYTALSLVWDWDLTLLFKFMILGGLPGIWALYELLPEWIHNWLGGFAPYRFFVYMGFDPLLTIVQDHYYAILPPSQLTNLLGYLCLPTIVVALCILLARCLRRRLPSLYFVLTGGR